MSSNSSDVVSEPLLQNADEEVQRLVGKALQLRGITEDVTQSLLNMRDSLCDLMSLQIELIHNRSKAWNEHQITVYDKVLLALTFDGKDLENLAAVLFFCEEYLGNRQTSEHELEKTISGRAQIRELLSRHHSDSTPDKICKAPAMGVVSNPASASCSSEMAGESSGLLTQPKVQNGDTNIVNMLEATTNAELATIAAASEPTIARLWEVLENAKQDYLTVEHQRDRETAQAAKYLRDTAENTVQCLADRDLDARLMLEAEKQYRRAEKKVLELNGGKKRKFDSRAMYRNSIRHSSPSYFGSCQREHSMEWRDVKRDRLHYPQNRAAAVHSKTRGSSSGADETGIKKPVGRGPSGVPYGYTRPVDQYMPCYHR